MTTATVKRQTKEQLQQRIDQLIHQVNTLHARLRSEESPRLKHWNKSYVGIAFKDDCVEREIREVASEVIAGSDWDTSEGLHFGVYEFGGRGWRDSPVAGIDMFVAEYEYDQNDGIFVHRVLQAVPVS